MLKDDSLTAAIIKAATDHHEREFLPGQPMIYHLIRVSETFETEDERIVGVLHEVGAFSAELYNSIELMRPLYKRDVVHALMLLGYRTGDNIMRIAQRASQTPLAAKVKLACILDLLEEGKKLKSSMPVPEGLLDAHNLLYGVVHGIPTVTQEDLDEAREMMQREGYPAKAFTPEFIHSTALYFAKERQDATKNKFRPSPIPSKPTVQ